MPIYALRRRDYLRNGGRVVVRREISQPPIGPHRHEFFEIVVILSGYGTHVTGSFRRRVEAGDVLVVNPRRTHGYEETRGLHLVNILIRADVMQRIGRELRELAGYHSLFNATASRWQRDDGANRLRLSTEELIRVEEWINRLEEESTSRLPGSDLIAEAYLTLIVGVLSRRHARRSGGIAPTRVALGKLLSWIEKNLHRPLRVADLARQAGMSERTLHREFRLALNVSPADYLIRCRMDRAAEWLRDQSQKRRISEIAEACGFEDSNYFSSCFRRVRGCSPREFRG